MKGDISLANGEIYPLSPVKLSETGLCSRFIFHAVQTIPHSEETRSFPRKENCRNPRAAFRMPKTGSTVLLRSAYKALPIFVRKRWRILPTGSDVTSGQEHDGTSNRENADALCRWRSEAIYGSISACTHARTFFSLKYPASARIWHTGPISWGSLASSSSMGSSSILIIAMGSEAMGHYEHTVGIHAGLCIVRLLETFPLGHNT